VAKAGVWWSMQPFLDDEDAVPLPEGSPNRAKFVAMTQGTDNAYALAKKHGVKLAWGTDTLFDPSLAARQGKLLAKMTRWFTPAQTLRMATRDNGELLAMSGPRSPYAGRVGVRRSSGHRVDARAMHSRHATCWRDSLATTSGRTRSER
jgi:hypothetical protein